MSMVARRYFVRGREHLRRGQLDDAEREFAAAVDLAPSFIEARIGHALTLSRTDPPRAAQSLRTEEQVAFARRAKPRPFRTAWAWGHPRRPVA